MALTLPSRPKDISVKARELPPDLQAESFFLRARAQRSNFFLKRSMTRALRVHKTRCAQRQQIANGRSERVQASTTNGVSNVTVGDAGSLVNGTVINGHTNGTGNSSEKTATNSTEHEHDTSIPAELAMSSETLQVKLKNATHSTESRRTSRRLEQPGYHNPDTSLYIGLSNIRKKLNWKTNRPNDNARPRKRAHVESVPCHLHLSIWDSSPNTQNNDPVIVETEFCELQRRNRDTDPVVGHYIDIKLNEPIIIPRKKFLVPVRKGSQRELEMAPHYFMEFKIVPTGTGSEWPPIPMLANLDAKSFTKLGTHAQEALQDTMVIRSQHLPNIPNRDMPLSIYFLRDGVTHGTKYGLELDAKWIDFKDAAMYQPRRKEQAQSWMLDDGGNPFGRPDPEETMVTIPPEPVPVATRRPGAARKSAATFNQGRSTTTKEVPKPLKVLYKYDYGRFGARDMVQKDFNRFHTKGNHHRCPLCPFTRVEITLEELLLHLEHNHHRYVFTINKSDTTNLEGFDAVIDIKPSEPIEVKKKHEHRRETGNSHETDHKIMNGWIAPLEPFDIHKHTIEGDRSWIGEKPRKQTHKTRESGRADDADGLIALRRKHNGFLPYQHVQSINSQTHKRKKHPNVRLLTQDVNLSMPYTSISHRPLIPENPDEEARSETDDDADDSWVVARQMENLDLVARTANWSDARHQLAKKWDYHLMHREKGNSAFIGDALIRFVRIELSWIRRDHESFANDGLRETARMESETALNQLMDELVEKRVIDLAVCIDVLEMLTTENDLALPEEKIEIERLEQEQRERKQRAEHQDYLLHRLPKNKNDPEELAEILQALPPNTCAQCRGSIRYDCERAVRCANPRCILVGVWWHAVCAGMKLPGENRGDGYENSTAVLLGKFMEERLKWKCQMCRAR